VSVILTLRAAGDPSKLEAHAAANPEAMRAIAARAEEHGLVAHRFYGSDDGQIMVVDEWPDPESFRRFYEQARAEIEPLMRAVGVSSEPQITFWRKLESHDEVGWGA
jgi:hypothetical protein